jgi:hypothetical protein
MLAVKAAGMQYGVAEKATIIPVKVLASVVDLFKGFEMIAAHMLENKNQNKHNPTMSVVLCAMRSPMEESAGTFLQTLFEVAYCIFSKPSEILEHLSYTRLETLVMRQNEQTSTGIPVF